MTTIAYLGYAPKRALRVILAASLPGSWPANTNPGRAVGLGPPRLNTGNQALWQRVEGTFTDSLGGHGLRRIHVYSRATGQLLGSTDTDPTTGAYSIRLAYTGEVKVTCQDDDAAPLNNDLVLRTFPAAP